MVVNSDVQKMAGEKSLPLFWRSQVLKAQDVWDTLNMCLMKAKQVINNLNMNWLRLTRWWFETFLFSPRKLGKMNPIWLSHIFQMGWWKTTNQLITEANMRKSFCKTLVFHVRWVWLVCPRPADWRFGSGGGRWVVEIYAIKEATKRVGWFLLWSHEEWNPPKSYKLLCLWFCSGFVSAWKFQGFIFHGRFLVRNGCMLPISLPEPNKNPPLKTQVNHTVHAGKSCDWQATLRRTCCRHWPRTWISR